MLFHLKKNFDSYFSSVAVICLGLSLNITGCGSKTSNAGLIDNDEEYLAEPIADSTAKGIIFLAEQVNATGRLTAYFYDFKEGVVVKLADVTGYTAKGISLSTGPSFILNERDAVNLISFVPSAEKEKRPYTIGNNATLELALNTGEPFAAKSTAEDKIIITAPIFEQSWIFDKDLEVLSVLAKKTEDIADFSFRPTGINLDQTAQQIFISSSALNFSNNYAISQESVLLQFQEAEGSNIAFSLLDAVSLSGDSPLGISISDSSIFCLSLCPVEADISCKNGIDVIDRTDFSHQYFAQITNPMFSVPLGLSRRSMPYLD